MGKLLLWAIVVLAVLIAMRLWSHKNAHQSAHKSAAQRRRTEDNARPDDATSEAMVRCAHCGVHLPRSEALLKNGQLWCCEAHARLGHADHD